MKVQKPDATRLRSRSGVFKALAHPTRLYFVEELSNGERCVCELAEGAGIDMSTASKHLSLLRNAGLVTDEKRGLQVFYQLKANCALRFLSCVESMAKTAAREQLASTK